MYAHHSLHHTFHYTSLTRGTGPQLRTVTNHSGQQIVIPFYVCEVKQPILSVTRLVEQGFQLTLDDNPKLHHSKGFDSTLESRNGLFFLQAEITALPKGTKLQIHNTDQGQIGMIAPTTTLTPQGPADTGYAGDYCQFNTQDELVRVHRQHRKTLFTPSRTQCPVPAEQLEDYRKTTIRLKDGTTNTFEDKYQTMEVPNKAQPQMWKGETTSRIKKGTTLPEAIQQQLETKTQPKSAPQKGDTTSDSVQTAHTAKRENNTTNSSGHTCATHRQRRSWTRTSTSFRSTPWRRLLVQRRPILEESTC